MKTCGIVTDEHNTSEDITSHILAFSKELEIADDQNLEFGDLFYRVGGKKIFRDFIYSNSAVFKADHLFYKRKGFYKDFPQQRIKQRWSNAVLSFLVSIKPLRKEIHKKMIPKMVEPYKKVLTRLFDMKK